MGGAHRSLDGERKERISLGVPSSLNLLWPFCSRHVSSVPPDPVAQGQLLLWAPVTPVVPLSLVLGVVVRCLLSTHLWQETRARTKSVRLSCISVGPDPVFILKLVFFHHAFFFLHQSRLFKVLR